MLDTTRPAVSLTTAVAVPGGTLGIGNYNYKVTFADRFGNESIPSDPISVNVASAASAVSLSLIPGVPSSYSTVRIYRNAVGGGGMYQLVAQLEAGQSTHLDRGGVLGGTLKRDQANMSGVTATAVAGGSLPLDPPSTTNPIPTIGTHRYRIVMVDANGREGLASEPSQSFTTTNVNRTLNLSNLPALLPGFVSRNIYRSSGPIGSTYVLIGSLGNGVSTFNDDGSVLAGVTVGISSTVGGNLAAGTYRYRVSFVDANGNENFVSGSTAPIQAAFPSTQNGTRLDLNNLPTAPAGSLRRIYRSFGSANNSFVLVNQDAGTATTFTDNVVPSSTTASIPSAVSLSVVPLGEIRSRFDASLTLDPGAVMKIEGARIEIGQSAQLLAEGTGSLRFISPASWTIASASEASPIQTTTVRIPCRLRETGEVFTSHPVPTLRSITQPSPMQAELPESVERSELSTPWKFNKLTPACRIAYSNATKADSGDKAPNRVSAYSLTLAPSSSSVVHNRFSSTTSLSTISLPPTPATRSPSITTR